MNRSFYDGLPSGQTDYWRYMAAPRFRRRVILDRLAAASPESVVDLGCGGGELLSEISSRLPSARLTGIDLSATRIAANRRIRADVDWIAADLDRPDAVPAGCEGRFDAVVAMEVVEHLDHPAEFLAVARSLARPRGGLLVLSTQSGTMRETERRVGHRRHFSAEQMRDILLQSGWDVVRVWNAGWPFHDLSKWWANRDPDASMARFSARPYGVTERLVCCALRGAFAFNSRRRGAQLFAEARRP